jgi:hypothetical protein
MSPAVFFEMGGYLRSCLVNQQGLTDHRVPPEMLVRHLIRARDDDFLTPANVPTPQDTPARIAVRAQS